jgi:hypothetical protein
MVKALVVFILGLFLGAGLMYELRPEPVIDQGPTELAPQSTASNSELERTKQRVAQLERELKLSEGAQAAHETVRVDGEISVSEEGAISSDRQEAVKWRVSAIDKFVPLNDDQKQRLAAKFSREFSSEGAGDEDETLDDILGLENATYYRGQVRAAFQRVQEEELEKEVLWIARQLSLSDVQERQIQEIFNKIEQQIDQELAAPQQGVAERSAQDRVKLMIAENRRRSELRNEQLKAALTPEQYEAYLRSQAESAASDIEVFHDPGGE